LSARDLPPRARFGSRQKFSLARDGRVAEASYRSLIVAARAQPGRPAFDAARSVWALSLSLQPDDGVYLGELRAGTINLVQITEALLVCGKTKADALTALGRLVDAGLVTATPNA
jgi:hypothetical protein